MSSRFPLKALAISIALTCLGVGALIWYATYEKPMGGDFSLTYRGTAWNFSENANKLNLLYFGYAKCPDVCPLTLSIASQAFKGLSEDELKKVNLIFLSVDRDHDIPDDVANYAAQFFPSFKGLSGSREQIDEAVSMYAASYVVEENPKSYLGYSISHSDRIYFLNKNGIVQTTIASPRSPDEIIKTIKELL